MFRNISKQNRRRLGREELVRPGKTPQFMPTEGAEIAAIGASECLATTIGKLSAFATVSTRLTRLTAGPITLKSSRSAA
jgi:hypothetical protein